MGRIAFATKVWLQRLLNRFGYRMERLIQTAKPIDVFDLAVRKVAAERGNEFFFVQIGANDGCTIDPIRQYVTEYHWCGLLVEPQPNVFEQLEKNYASEPQLRFVNAAIARENGTATIYTVPTNGPPTMAQVMASFDRNLLMKQIPNGTSVIALSVPTMTFEKLLQTHDVSRIDLLQIDTEGYDFEIIKMLDFNTLKPGVIHYEHRHLSDSDRIACEQLLLGGGYRLHVVGPDTTAIVQG